MDRFGLAPPAVSTGDLITPIVYGWRAGPLASIAPIPARYRSAQAALSGQSLVVPVQAWHENLTYRCCDRCSLLACRSCVLFLAVSGSGRGRGRAVCPSAGNRGKPQPHHALRRSGAHWERQSRSPRGNSARGGTGSGKWRLPMLRPRRDNSKVPGSVSRQRARRRLPRLFRKYTAAPMSCPSSPSPDSPSGSLPAVTAIASLMLLVLGWFALRVVFFTGFIGSDDFFHLRYATLWEAPPANHWEARLAYNGLLRALITLFGNREWVWAAPSLLGSLLLTLAAVFGATRAAGLKAGLFAGWLAAAMPLDVVLSTVPIASSLSAALAGWFFVFMISGWTAPAVAAGALSALVHPVNLHFLLVSAAVFACVRRKLPPLLLAAAAVCLYLLLDLGIHWLAWGDPVEGLRILSRWHDPDPNHRPGSISWLLFPLQSLIISKDFGLTALLASGVLLFRPSRQGWAAVCSLTVAAFWIWVGYGSAKPFSYEPFWRLTRFQHPLIVPVGIAIAVFFTERRYSLPLSAAAIGLFHILLLAGSGSFGESVEISRRFLAETRSQPEKRFLTDLRTQREMLALNSFQPLQNVQSWPAVCSTDSARGEWLLLENPLNLALLRGVMRQQPRMSPAGEAILSLDPVPRRLFAWAPGDWLARWPVLVRRPRARVLPVKVHGCPD